MKIENDIERIVLAIDCDFCPAKKDGYCSGARLKTECIANIERWRHRAEVTYRKFIDSDELVAVYKRRFSDESKMPKIWVRSGNGNRYLIMSMTKRAVVLVSTQNAIPKMILVGVGDLLDKYTFIDGTACGRGVDNDE